MCARRKRWNRRKKYCAILRRMKDVRKDEMRSIEERGHEREIGMQERDEMNPNHLQNEIFHHPCQFRQKFRIQ